ncbi:MAG: glycosyltransferase family 2 protein [Pseudomonadota bacterium]
MTKCPISAFIITKNEEKRLPATLAALDWVDQVIVVDSGSTDATLQIAERAGAEIHHREWTGYGPQKVFAEQLCANDWVLNVDADEVVTPELAAEIGARIAAGQPPAAFRLRILTVYPGDEHPRPLADDFNEIRFYHRSVGGYRDHPVFDRVETQEGCRIEQLRAPVWHFTLIDWAQFVDKENRHSSFLAAHDGAKRRPLLKLRLGLELPLTFLKFYLLRRHVTGGWKGFFFALSAAYARTLRLAKILEYRERGSLSETGGQKKPDDND